MRRNFLRRCFSSSCAYPEKQQEEERWNERSQNVALTPNPCQRNPHFSEILRVHSQVQEILASPC